MLQLALLKRIIQKKICLVRGEKVKPKGKHIYYIYIYHSQNERKFYNSYREY